MHEFKILTCTMAVTFVIPNLAILLCMACQHRRLLKTASNKLVFSLLLAHSCSNVFNFIRTFYPSNLFLYWMFPTGVIIVYLCLAVLSLDRLYAIQLPYRYEHLPNRYAVICIAGSWVPPCFYYISIAILYTTLDEKNAEQKTRFISAIVLTIMTIASTILLTVSNIIIYKVAKLQIRKIAISTPRPSLPFCSEKNKRRSISQKRELKAAFVCMSLTGTMIILWLPMNVYRVLIMFDTVVPLLCEVGVLSGLINSLVDPVLYIAFKHDLRKEICAFYLRRSLPQVSIEYKRGSVSVTVKPKLARRCTKDVITAYV